MMLLTRLINSLASGLHRRIALIDNAHLISTKEDLVQARKHSTGPIFHIGIFLIAALMLGGCAAGTTAVDDSGDRELIVVDAQALAAVDDGERYRIDLLDSAALYKIDLASKGFDASRVDIVRPSGAVVSLPEYMEQAAEAGHPVRDELLLTSGIYQPGESDLRQLLFTEQHDVVQKGCIGIIIDHGDHYDIIIVCQQE